jgi:hypothetical protein
MIDPISALLGIALGATLCFLVKHLIIDGLRLRRELIATRKRIALERWRMKQQAGSRLTPPPEGGNDTLPYLGIDEVPVFTDRSQNP